MYLGEIAITAMPGSFVSHANFFDSAQFYIFAHIRLPSLNDRPRCDDISACPQGKKEHTFSLTEVQRKEL